MHNELHMYNQSINDEACLRSLELTPIILELIQLQNVAVTFVNNRIILLSIIEVYRMGFNA